MVRRTSPRLRRSLLGALALGVFAAPALASGCAAGFAPISEIDGLRVISVQADTPYIDPAPGSASIPANTTVKFTMKAVDSRADAVPPQIVWIGGCFDPPGDAYYGCYSQLASIFQDFSDPDKLLASGYVGFGAGYSLPIPEDLITRRPQPEAGAPWYGVAYVFFMACAGELQPVPAEGTSEAGSFPIGCFDKAGNRLGAESFIPGYTQVYAFADGRSNHNPTIESVTLDGEPLTGGPDTAPEVEACPVSEEDRLGPKGCGKEDPEKACKTYNISVTVPDDVGEDDPSGTLPDGTRLRETVWVDYFAEAGNFTGDAQLVSDAVYGIRDDFSVQFIPPASEGEPRAIRVWAVLHDSRGGQEYAERYLIVK